MMKNKSGFTLVELLAVIAILAILVIIALPNVLKLYNNAKKNTFLIEAKTIYKEASSKSLLYLDLEKIRACCHCPAITNALFFG